MKKTTGNVLQFFLVIGAIALVCSLIYGSYWVAKTVSYSIFYEDMVQQTISEMVKAGVLK